MRRGRIWLLRRIGRALSPYVWPPALVERLASLEDALESDGAETRSRRLDRLDLGSVSAQARSEAGDLGPVVPAPALYACVVCSENVPRFGATCERCRASLEIDRLERESGR